MILSAWIHRLMDGRGWRGTRPDRPRGVGSVVAQIVRSVVLSLTEALFGPWRYDSTLPSFGWDNRGERIYAVRATNPSKDKRLGVPGADWLAFLGLSYFPVWNQAGTLRTTACAADWKHGTFTWPLWSRPLAPPVIRSLLRDPSVGSATDDERRIRGITVALRAPIRRSDQGGYGSFGAAEPVVGATASAHRNRPTLLHTSWAPAPVATSAASPLGTAPSPP